MQNKNIIAVCNLIRCLEIESLKNPEVVANLVRAFGIVQWNVTGAFGDDEKFKNLTTDMAGIYQTPDQIGKALAYISEYKINTFLEVGVFQGGNFLFMSEYLRRFNPKIKCIGIDPTQFLNDDIRQIIETELWLSFKAITSDELCGQKFDLVFIDAEHSAEWINRDFDNVGQYAKICMIHDIHESSCPDIVAFWETKKNDTTVEFLDYTSEQPSQGIGVIHNEKGKDKV